MFYNPEKIVLFDIETTGFAAEATMLYLIGCCYYDNGSYYIRQWFNDDGESEQQILHEFYEFTYDYDYIMSYNGNGFDIPYIDKKCKKYKLANPFQGIESIDLYKIIKPYRNVFHIDNLKQKSIELYLGINRLDKYSGGDLIKIYNEYQKTHDEIKKKLLLQHNYDDIEGLLYCSCLLSISKLKQGCIKVKNMNIVKNKLVFSLDLDYPIPKRIAISSYNIVLSCNNKEATISVPILEDELKFFFDNYRDYYYLPSEDRAIHKSVATYVDKDYRQRATKDNCYVKKHGYFITQLDAGIISGYKYYFDSKETYIELVDSFLQDIDLINNYVKYILSIIID